MLIISVLPRPPALSRRVSDEFTVPLCRLHHRALHRRGDEAAWWAEVQLDPVPVARKLWAQSRLGAPGRIGENGQSQPTSTPDTAVQHPADARAGSPAERGPA